MGLKENIIAIDQFGAMFQFSVYQNEHQYKTWSGALATIAIYSLSGAYFIFLIQQWFSGQLLPKITSLNKYNQQGKSITFEHTPFNFNMEVDDHEQFEEYHQKKLFNISSHIKHNLNETTNNNYQPHCEDKVHQDHDLIQTICIDLNDTNQRAMEQRSDGHNDYFGYIFKPCDEINSDCIDYNIMSQFLEDEKVQARLTTYTYEYDVKLNQLNLIPFDYFFFLHPTSKSIVNMYITMKNVHIMKGILFPSEEIIEFIGEIRIITQAIPRNKEDSYTQLWVSLEKVDLEVQIEYPSLPDIMSQFNFIFSTLMTIGMIFNHFNTNFLKSKLVSEMGKIYFHNYEALIEKQMNYKRKITPEEQKDTHLFSYQIKELLNSRCNFLSIVHELSKIQMALQTILTKEQLACIQFMRYKLPTYQERTQTDKLQNDKSLALGFPEFKIFTKTFIEQQQQSTAQQDISRDYSIYERVNKQIQQNLPNNYNFMMISFQDLEANEDISERSSQKQIQQFNLQKLDSSKNSKINSNNKSDKNSVGNSYGNSVGNSYKNQKL